MAKLRGSMNALKDASLSTIKLASEQIDSLIKERDELYTDLQALRADLHRKEEALKDAILQIHDLTDYSGGRDQVNYAKMQESALSPQKPEDKTTEV